MVWVKAEIRKFSKHENLKNIKDALKFDRIVKSNKNLTLNDIYPFIDTICEHILQLT